VAGLDGGAVPGDRCGVFLLRSFLFEPFKIPSGSMIPTLLVGDLILVNKFTYGVRLPVINTKLTEGNAVQRGDVMVFRYPPSPAWTTSSAWWACRVTRWPT
jgi:signal peptidase I